MRQTPSADTVEILCRALAQAREGLGLYVVESELRLVYANSVFAEFVPHAATRPLTSAFDDAHVSRTLRDAIRTNTPCSTRATVHDEFGVARTLSLSATPVLDCEQRSATHWLCRVHELSDELGLERERSERERLAAVGLLAAGLAHEINNPLASVTTNLEWLAATLPSVRPNTPRPNSPVPALSAALVDALAGAERIEASVRQLNALTGVQQDSRELLDVRVLLDAALREIEPLVIGSIRVRRDYAEVPLISGGEARLRQAFSQLLTNAAQAIAPESARRDIDVRVRHDELVRIEIDDSGSGVPPHLQGELFRPFVTTKPLGLGKGLGLYLARASIEAAGGKVGFHALPDGGTRFWIELPASETKLRSPLDSASDLESVPPK